MKKRILAGLFASSVVVLSAVALDGPAKSTESEPKAEVPNLLQLTPKQCAYILGIHWSNKEGVTEELDAFQRCMSYFEVSVLVPE